MLKTNQKYFAEKKSFNCLKGPPLSPNTIWFFPQSDFFFNIHKKCIWYKFKILSQKYASNKKERNFWRQGLLIAAFKLSFSQCWWKRSILEGKKYKISFLGGPTIPTYSINIWHSCGLEITWFSSSPSPISSSQEEQCGSRAPYLSCLLHLSASAEKSIEPFRIQACLAMAYKLPYKMTFCDWQWQLQLQLQHIPIDKLLRALKSSLKVWSMCPCQPVKPVCCRCLDPPIISSTRQYTW